LPYLRSCEKETCQGLNDSPALELVEEVSSDSFHITFHAIHLTGDFVGVLGFLEV
jgi:hypothetical protein